MRLSRTDAALLNSRELQLVTSKGPWRVSELATLIRHVRDRRDKQRDLLQRQTGALARAGKGRGGAMATPNARTEAKARIFDEALTELEGHLRDIDQESTLACRELLDDDVPGRRANPPKRTATRSKSAAAKKTVAPGARTARKSESKPAKKAAPRKASQATMAQRTTAKKAPGSGRSSQARVAVPKRLAGDADARPLQASRKTRGTNAR